MLTVDLGLGNLLLACCSHAGKEFIPSAPRECHCQPHLASSVYITNRRSCTAHAAGQRTHETKAIGILVTGKWPRNVRVVHAQMTQLGSLEVCGIAAHWQRFMTNAAAPCPVNETADTAVNDLAMVPRPGFSVDHLRAPACNGSGAARIAPSSMIFWLAILSSGDRKIRNAMAERQECQRLLFDRPILRSSSKGTAQKPRGRRSTQSPGLPQTRSSWRP